LYIDACAGLKAIVFSILHIQGVNSVLEGLSHLKDKHVNYSLPYGRKKESVKDEEGKK
jgi:hypothetical protein